MGRGSNESLPDISGKLLKPQQSDQSRSRRSRRAAILLFGLLILLAAVSLLPHAWRETSRREAYLPELETEARAAPFDGRLQALLGGRLMQAGEYPAAADSFRRALAAGEQSPLLWLNLAAAVAASGDPARAVGDLNLGLRALPNAADLHTALDRVHAAAPSAAGLPQTISPLGAAPLVDLYTSGSFLNGLVEWWGRRHPEESGFTTRLRWAAEKPDDAEPQRLWGLALLRNRRVTEAGVILDHAVALDPNSPSIHLARADVLDAAGLSTKAIFEYIECLKLRPKWLSALLGVGRTGLETGMNAYALTGYQRATEVAPGSVDAWIGLGRAYRKTGVDHDKSIAAFQTAARLAPERTDYYDDYADALRQGVQWPAAEAILRKRLQGTPGDALAHYLLGMVLLNADPTPQRQAEAETETREALRLLPHNPLSDLQLAQIVLSRREVAEAIALLTDALKVNPYNRNAMTVLARAYRQAGRADMAEKTAKQADLLFQDQQRVEVLRGQEAKQLMSVGIHAELARLYGRIGEPKKAMYEQNIAQLLRDNPKQAAEELEKFRTTRSAALPSE